MPVTHFILQDDSAGADTITPLLAALHTATAAKYTGDVVQSVRPAAHDATQLLVKANITDAERVGDLAALHRDNYGVGIYLDEYVDLDGHAREAFSILGESGRVNKHYEMPDEYTVQPDGSWLWAQKADPGNNDGRTYGNRILGYPTANGRFGSLAGPASNKEDHFFHGFWVQIWGLDNSGTLVGQVALKLFNGASPTEKFNYYFDHPLKPATISKGLIPQIPGVSWTKDGGSNAYSIPEGTWRGASNTKDFANIGYRKFYDLDPDTREFAGELAVAASVADCKATPGTTFWDATLDGGDGGWWVHMPDGSHPGGRVVGLGNKGYEFNFRSVIAAETVKENIAFHGPRFRGYEYRLTTSASDITTIRHIDFHMLNHRYATQRSPLWDVTASNHFGGVIEDITFNVDQVSRAANAFYLIAQQDQPIAVSSRITIQADPKARDGRENIFDIGGAVVEEINGDGHAVGIQTTKDLIVRWLKIRRTGGAIVAYARSYPSGTLSSDMSPLNRPFSGGLIEGNDIAEHSPHYAGIGQTSPSVGIHLSSDNAQMWDTSGWIVRDNTVRGYDTIPENAFAHCFRHKWNAQARWEGNHGDLSSSECFKGILVQTIKYLDLTGASGNWKLGDHIEDAANPGVSLGAIWKIENANPTPRLWYGHPTSQVNTAPDIAGPITVNNMDDTGTGSLGVGGSTNAGVMGPNILITNSAARRSRFGNSGGTVKWLTVVTGATLGSSVDPATERNFPATILQESNTDFIGASDGYVGFDIAGLPEQSYMDYLLNSATNCVFGSGSARLMA